MKLKNKILLASAGLLVLGGSAAATSTFAWYTANRTAGVNATNISAENEASGLKVETWEPAGVTMKGAVDTKDSSKIAYTANNKDSYLVDVSSKGDGKYMKAQFDADGSTYVGSWANESTYETVNTNAIWKHRLGFKVTIDSKDKGKSIAAFINPKALKIEHNGDPDVTSSIRMSIRSYTTEPTADGNNEIAEDTANGHSWYVIPHKTETKHTYSSVTEATEGVKASLKNDNSVDETKVITPSGVRVTSSTVKIGDYKNAKGYLGDSSVSGETATGTPIYVIAEVWLEGTATKTNLTGGSFAPTPGTPDITDAGFTLTFGISSVDVSLLS